jgi:hypothetical protein
MFAGLAAEDMDQDITVIHDNPMADRYAVDVPRMDFLLLERLAQMIHNRPDMGVGVAAADDIVIGEDGRFSDVVADDIFRLAVLADFDAAVGELS